MKMRIKSRLVAVFLVAPLLLSTFYGCGNSSLQNSTHTSSGSANSTEMPNISVSVVETSGELDEKETALSNLANSGGASIKSMVASAVSFDLEDRGYVTQSCVAFTKDKSYLSNGIGYYYPDFQMFDGSDYYAMGFTNVIGPDDEYKAIPEDSEFVGIEPIEGSLDNNAQYNLLAYTCDSLVDNHFIYNGKYVIYYQLDSTTIKYETFENKKENYDLSLGTLYDFDNGTIIYNADLFDGYETHSGVQLFSENDYTEIQRQLAELSAKQEENGYRVEEVNVVYITPEAVQAYISSQEKDTFYGYTVSELEASFGKGTALVYTENGFQTAQKYEQNPEDYDWKSFLLKIGIGCGIIIAGAILAPITGGTSFGCALVTISKIAVTTAVTSAVTTLAISTASNMMNGESFKDAISHAAFSGLDAFANGFVIGAATASVGVVTGIIKPVACFAAGTPIAVYSTSGITHKNIENISVGDLVYSYDTRTERIVVKPVVELYYSQSDQLLDITINDEEIKTTKNHPFYNPDDESWVCASSLHVGERVFLASGKAGIIKDIELENEKGTPVYNFKVYDTHNYFVGSIGVLVHNKCDAEITNIQSARNKGVREAWKKEVEAVNKGTSKYNWTPKELEQLLTKGKVKGYDGCHIVDVQVNPSLAADPKNIIFLKHEVHINVVHGGNTHNLSRWGEIVKIMPQFKKQILAIGGAL